MKYSDLIIYMTCKQGFSRLVNGTEFSITKRLDRRAVAWSITSEGTLVNIWKLSHRNGKFLVIDNGHRFTMTTDTKVTELSCQMTHPVFFETQEVKLRSVTV